MTRLERIRAPEKDYGLGRCACGKFAVVGLNERGGCCLACFEGTLKKMKRRLARLEELDA